VDKLKHMKLIAIMIMAIMILSVSAAALESISGGPTEWQKFGTKRARRYGDICISHAYWGTQCKEKVEFHTSRFVQPFKIYGGVFKIAYKPSLARVGKEEIAERLVRASTNYPAGYKPEEALRPADRGPILLITGKPASFQTWNRLRGVNNHCYFDPELGATCPGLTAQRERSYFKQAFKPGLARVGKEELLV